MDCKDSGDALSSLTNRVRLSSTVQKSPEVNPGLMSPVRSVHPEMMAALESINSQSDMGLRTTDFFDDISEDDAGQHPFNPIATDFAFAPRRESPTIKRQQSLPLAQMVSQCKARRSTAPDIRHSLPIRSQNEDDRSTTSSTGMSPDVPGLQNATPPRGPYTERSASRQRAYSSSIVDSSTLGLSDQIYGAHALAHDITLQALMRHETALDYGLQSLRAPRRGSPTPQDVRMHDPRSPRDCNVSTSTTNKKASVLPPPIDLSATTRSFPTNPLRTPYPRTADIHSKKFGRSPATISFTSPRFPTESILTLSIRRQNKNSRPRITTLTIPLLNNTFTTIPGASDNSTSSGFDDATLFTSLRTAYTSLLGPLRHLSARTLTRIVVSGPASKAADAGYGWIHSPRSPRFLAWKGLSDSFSEDKILQHFRKPALGRGRYAFVQWTHRLAAAPEELRIPVVGHREEGEGREEGNAELVRKREQPEGLEFVVTWSVSRISMVLGLVILLSVAAVLLWVFLGKNTHVAAALATTRSGGLAGDENGAGGFGDAGDRVGTGVLLGICVLLLGLASMAGWIGISWLVL